MKSVVGARFLVGWITLCGAGSLVKDLCCGIMAPVKVVDGLALHSKRDSGGVCLLLLS